MVGGRASWTRCAAAGIDRIVFSSTAAVYGEPERMPITEATRPDPSTHTARPSSRSRAPCAGCGRDGLRSVALRYFNVAGASDAIGEDHEPETHLIPNLLRAVERASP